MLQKITSKKVELPPIWLVENQEDWDNLPAGLPRIIGTQKELGFIRVFLCLIYLRRGYFKERSTGVSQYTRCPFF